MVSGSYSTRGVIIVRRLYLASLVAASAPFLGATAADLTAAAYQVSPAHNALVQFSKTWGPSLKVLWTAALDGSASYPLYANGYVYALVSGSPDEIVAINATTGAVEWKASTGSNEDTGIAYDEGRVFVVNFGGTMTAFDAAKGRLKWAVQLPGQYAFSSAPSALNGTVYTGGAGDGGTLYAVDGKSGKVLWTQSVANGDDSSPAVTDTGVYVSYPCQYYDFAPKTGKLVWQYNGGCDGGGGETVVVGAGLAFVRNFPDGPNTIFKAKTGATVGSFAASEPPAVVSGKLAYFLDNSTLSAIGPRTSLLFWEFQGDGSLSTPPIAVNSWVVEASSEGHLYVLNGQTGTVGSTTTISGSIGQALGAGGGMILVPVGSTLIAFGSTT
jgi:outer membrane protein assembly factor BamB